MAKRAGVLWKLRWKGVCDRFELVVEVDNDTNVVGRMEGRRKLSRTDEDIVGAPILRRVLSDDGDWTKLNVAEELIYPRWKLRSR